MIRDGRPSGRSKCVEGPYWPLFLCMTVMTTIQRLPDPRWKRVCIFVDGENFRFSLGNLFRDGTYRFRAHDYLPEADWHGFFQALCARPGWELVRVYWYVTREIDYWPYKVPFEWEKKERFLRGRGILKHLTDQGCRFAEGNEGLREAEKVLHQRRQAIQKRADGWQAIHASIERRYDQIQFQSFGTIRYDLVERSFGTEKGVDTQLATDLITLSDIYDVALLVSGDADYIPPVAAVKNMGKLVYSVSFLTGDGTKLPGGAWRLERSVDGQIELPFEQIRELLRVEQN